MEELDFEDVLSIHPDEDIKKIETYANSNLEQVNELIETDINSNLEEALESDAGEIDDGNSDLEQGNKLIDADANLNLEQASDSDSGEIDDDEEVNDLEEGEIKDSNADVKKKSDIACRFFKRGSCAFGSQCQFLHVSDKVYNMFDTTSQMRNDVQVVEHQNFQKPVNLFPNTIPLRPYIAPPIPVSQKSDFHRQCDTFEDNWEKGLEQARILIRKANLRKKNEDNEPKKIDSRDEKVDNAKGQYFNKINRGNEMDIARKNHFDKVSTYNSFNKEESYDKKKSNSRYQPRSSDKWVDPWRRSKSPDWKLKSRTNSPPSRSRKHSYSSSTSSISSSSSGGDSVFKKSYKRKSSRDGRVSRSRSTSQSRQPKKRRISPKRPFHGKKNSLSSRSFSISPYRKKTTSSRSRSSSSSSSCSDYERSPSLEEKEMKRISEKLNDQLHKKPLNKLPSLLDSDCETSELTVSSASCTSISSDSDSGSSHHSPSLKSVPSNQNNVSTFSSKPSSLSNAKVFNKYESNLLKSQTMLQQRDRIAPAFEKKMQLLSNNSGRNQNNCSSKSELRDCKPKNSGSSFNSAKKPPSEVSKNKKSNDMELLFMYQDLSSSNKNSNNIQKTKPNKTENTPKLPNQSNNNLELNKNVSKVRNVPSHDMQMLFMYQDLGNANKSSNNVAKVKPNDSTSKPYKSSDNGKDASINSESYDRLSKVQNVPKQNIVLNLNPKSKHSFKPEIYDKQQELDDLASINKKRAASKRELLLNKLKLIDDAIARKKSK